MKELSIEEKAKRYDEAIERARLINNKGTWVRCGSTGPSICEQIFPELKESEDERIRKAIINVFATHKDYEIFFGVSVKDILAWLEKQAQKTAWSEEDGKIIIQIKKALEDFFSASETDKIKYWLNSLKDRVQPQNLTITDEELAQAKKDAYNDTLDKIEYHSGEPTFDDGWSAAIWYLKKRNAQPQNTWRPSDEQMNALWSATEKYLESDNENVRKLRGEVLESLYEDLKKLKG